MGRFIGHGRVKLVISVIYREKKRLEEAELSLKRIFGPTEDLQLAEPFDFTDYYNEEFGSPLHRKVFVFKELIPVERAHRAKLLTGEIENKMSVFSKRTVNIDPGYVTEAKLVLFTTKDYSHRIYLADNIFAECTLFFRAGSFNAWPWTYPDYASAGLRDFFVRVRELYVGGLTGSGVMSAEG
jgi:hypothetical protein